MSLRDLDQEARSSAQAIREDGSPWLVIAARLVRALLALYLLPVIALVLVVGGLAAIAQKICQIWGRPSTTIRRPIRFRHAPHLGMPAVRAWLRSAR